MTNATRSAPWTEEFRDYLIKMAGGFVPSHEADEAYRLATATLQAERDALLALVQTFAKGAPWTEEQKAQYNAALNEARALLARLDGRTG